MSDKFTFQSAGEIQELEFAFARAEWSHAEVKELTKGDVLAHVREMIRGEAKFSNEVRTSPNNRRFVFAIRILMPFNNVHMGRGFTVVYDKNGGSGSFDVYTMVTLGGACDRGLENNICKVRFIEEGKSEIEFEEKEYERSRLFRSSVIETDLVLKEIRLRKDAMDLVNMAAGANA